jgi:hypothetical protein
MKQLGAGIMQHWVLSIGLPAALVFLAAQGNSQEKYADPEVTPKDRQHWSFQAPVRPKIPVVDEKVAENPIDAFIIERLQKAGLKPSQQAGKLTLIRRVTLDLTGLPPTPAEVDAFLKDDSPNAYEKVVDRLLASPHFGERWAQHWLDVVRYADSNGYEADSERPHAWRYRDYVVKSFNDDKPYDRFVTEQIAGDELAAGKEPRDVTDLWFAAGMHRCGPIHKVGGNLDAAVIRQEQLTEMVNGMGAAFLGLTVGCARCHDHKFDPFSQGDYFRLQAFFSAVDSTELDLSTSQEEKARQKTLNELNAKMTSLKTEIAAIDAPYRNKIGKTKRDSLEPKYKDALAVPAEKRTPAQVKLVTETAVLVKVTWEDVLMALTPGDRERRVALRSQLHELEAQVPPPASAAWTIKNGDKVPETFVLKRGDPKRKLSEVKPGFPRVISEAAEQPKTRIELAKWLTSTANPLTARVIVNRLWHYHFGRGLVATPNDFGLRGDRPTNPELLDYLACELMNPTGQTKSQPWSLKHIHRLVVLSTTYRQEVATTQGAKVDPDNLLLWRMNRHRLEAESIRDAVLSVAGTLNRQVGGTAVKVPLEPEVYDLIFTESEPDGLWPVTPDVAQHTRRSIYLFNKRNVRLPMFEAFDQPDTLNTCAFRPVSTYAPQALILMNGPLVREQGKSLAVLLVKECGPDAKKQIDTLYRRAVGRSPRGEEARLAMEFLDAQTDSIRDRLRARLPIGVDPKTLPADVDLARVRAMADLCVVMFNTHEFVYRP